MVKLTGGRLHIVSAYKPEQYSVAAGEEFAKSLDSGDLADAVLSELGSRAGIAGMSAETHRASDRQCPALPHDPRH